jgi:4-hydroxybenzoate polyprenyltransferase
MNHVTKLFKFKNWWAPKIGTGVFTWFLFKIYFRFNQDLIFEKSHWLVFVILVLLAFFGHLVNDISDLKQDIQVGKENIWNIINPKFSLLILIVLSFISIAFASLVSSQLIVLIFIQITLNLLYSVRPLRFKERGWLSIIITGFYERTLPYLIIVVSLNIMIEFNFRNLLFIISYFLWAYLWECRNYINGQLKDRENDLHAGSNTLAVVVEREKLVTFKRYLFFLEFLMVASWLFAFSLHNSLFFFIFFGVLSFIVLTHFHVINNLFYVKKLESFLDFMYTHAWLSAMMIASMMILLETNFFFNITLLLLFTSSYTIEIVKFVYRRIFFVISFVVNQTIYYFRKIFPKN